VASPKQACSYASPPFLVIFRRTHPTTWLICQWPPLWAREIEPVYEARGKAVDTGVRDGQSRLPFEIKDATNNLWHNKPRQCDFDVENKLAIGNEMTTVKATRRA